MQFKIILASVKTEITDQVVDAAKKAGATGATIIPARGTGVHEAKTFFGLTLEAQTDIIMFLIEKHHVRDILSAIQTAGNFPACIPISELVFRIADGAARQMAAELFRKFPAGQIHAFCGNLYAGL